MDSSSSADQEEQRLGTWILNQGSDGSSSMQCPYYVQSPLSSSLDVDVKISSCLNNNHLSPTRSDEDSTPLTKDVGFTLSRYSSSRGSSANLSFLHDHHKKKVIVSGGEEENSVNNIDTGAMNKSTSRGVIVDRIGFSKEEEEDDDGDGDGDCDGEEYFYEKMRASSGSGWRRYFSFNRRSSCTWIWVQLSWRFLVSFWLAFLVFYIATKPPPPKVFIKVAGMSEFWLAEGVDSTGVTTKILTCNCSVDILIENKSKLFDLHIHPPILELSFGHLVIAKSRGSKFYADNHDSTSFRLYVGTRNKPIYGAGRNMQDLMESGRGLPIEVRMKLHSYFRVVSNIIRPKFHHKAECMLLLDETYDKKYHIAAFRSSCSTIVS